MRKKHGGIADRPVQNPTDGDGFPRNTVEDQIVTMNTAAVPLVLIPRGEGKPAACQLAVLRFSSDNAPSQSGN